MLALPIACRDFIGRQRELALLQECCCAAAAARGSLALIGGEPGIGKTRLLAEFRANVARRHRLAGRADCIENAAAPFGAVRLLLRALVANTRLRACITPLIGRALAQLIPEDGPYFADEAEAAPVLEKTDLFAALLAFLKIACDERTTILTIEDLHWADASTLEFLAYLAPRIARLRLLIVATYRADDITVRELLGGPAADSLRGEEAVLRLSLGGFSDGELRAVIAGALRNRPALPPALREQIERTAEGNPFFAEELLKSALEPGGGTSLPISVGAIILERFARLRPDERRMVAGAAVIGIRFDPLLLGAVLECEVAALGPALAAACNHNLLVAQDGVYRFRHALTHRAIYDDLLRIDARRLHERVLRVLEARSDAERRLDELAYHAAKACDGPKTLAYSERAGDAAHAMRALPYALLHYGNALEAASDEGDRVRLMEKTARVARIRGDLERSSRLSQEAFDLRAQRREFDEAAALIHEIACDRNHGGSMREIAEVGAVNGAFFQTYGAQLSHAARNRFLAWMGRRATCTYDFDAAERAYAALSPIEELDPRTRFSYWQGVSVIYAARNDASAWREAIRGLRATQDDLPPLVGAVGLTTVAQTALSFGESAEAERATGEALALAQTWGDHGIVTFARALEAFASLLRGRLTMARWALESALEPPHIPVVMTLAGASGPLLALALDDDELAERCIALFEPLLSRERADVNGVDAVNFGALAAWRASRGHLTRARNDLLLALDAVASADQRTTLLPTAAHLLCAADVERVRGIARDAAQQGDNPVARAIHAQVEAIAAARAGDEKRAIAHASAAADVYRSLAWPLLEAQNLELAGDRAAALELYRRCGSISDVRRLGGLAGSSVAESKADHELSERESEVVPLVVQGLTNVEIAERLHVNHKTVEKHLSAIYAKFDVRSRFELISRYAARPDAHAQAETERRAPEAAQN